MPSTTQLLVITHPVQLRQNTAPTQLAQVKGGPPGPGVDLLTMQGDLLTHGPLEPVRLPVGLDGQMLTANSGASSGLLWNGVVIRRAITQDITVIAGTTAVQRNPELADGVTVTINDGGELVTL